MILAIDPGTEESGWVVYDDRDGAGLVSHGTYLNDEVLTLLSARRSEFVYDCAIEMVASFGMAVGAEVFHAVLWAGRFYEAARRAGLSVRLIYRKQVALHICRSAAAGDANVRAALLDRFGGKKAARGTKKAPGPLYGLKGDAWAALGVAVTASEVKP